MWYLLLARPAEERINESNSNSRKNFSARVVPVSVLVLEPKIPKVQAGLPEVVQSWLGKTLATSALVDGMKSTPCGRGTFVATSAVDRCR